MIVERSTHPQFLSNTYLVADGEGGPAFFVDAGGPVEPLIEAAERLGLTPTHVLLTHHHFDHVCEVAPAARALAGARGADQPARARRCSRRPAGGGGATPELATGTIEAGADAAASARSRCGRCTRPGTPPGCSRSWSATRRARRRRRRPAAQTRSASSAPGASRREAVVFTGDTLFKDSVGGVRAPGHTHLHRPEGLDHGHADGAAAGDRHLPRPRRGDDRRPGVGARTPSSASGGAWTPRAPSPARRSASPRRWCCWAPTTTAARRPGCAGRTAATTSSPAPRSPRPLGARRPAPSRAACGS